MEECSSNPYGFTKLVVQFREGAFIQRHSLSERYSQLKFRNSLVVSTGNRAMENFRQKIVGVSLYQLGHYAQCLVLGVSL